MSLPDFGLNDKQGGVEVSSRFVKRIRNNAMDFSIALLLPAVPCAA